MSNGDESVCKIVRSYLDSKNIQYKKVEEEYSTNFKASSFGQKANIRVFNTGKIDVQGGASKLKEKLEEIKEKIENEDLSTDQFLDSDSILKDFPERGTEIIPFIKEAVDCFNGGKILAAFHLLALAAEKTIHVYVKSQNRMLSYIYGLMIPGYQNPIQNIKQKTEQEQLIDEIMHYYRIARTSYGHPKNVKELEPDDIKRFIQNITKLYEIMS